MSTACDAAIYTAKYDLSALRTFTLRVELIVTTRDTVTVLARSQLADVKNSLWHTHPYCNGLRERYFSTNCGVTFAHEKGHN